MPFITEELWHAVRERGENETIMFESYPVAGECNAEYVSAFGLATEAVAGIRNIRQQKGLSPKEPLKAYFVGDFSKEMESVVAKLANVNEIHHVSSIDDSLAGMSFMAGTVKVFVPLEGLVDATEEIAKLEDELEYLRGFLKSVRGKLSNEKFVSHAPEAVVAAERKKEADTLSKIESVEHSLKALRGQC